MSNQCHRNIAESDSVVFFKGGHYKVNKKSFLILFIYPTPP